MKFLLPPSNLAVTKNDLKELMFNDFNQETILACFFYNN